MGGSTSGVGRCFVVGGLMQRAREALINYEPRGKRAAILELWFAFAAKAILLILGLSLSYSEFHLLY